MLGPLWLSLVYGDWARETGRMVRRSSFLFILGALPNLIKDDVNNFINL